MTEKKEYAKNNLKFHLKESGITYLCPKCNSDNVQFLTLWGQEGLPECRCEKCGYEGKIKDFSGEK